METLNQKRPEKTRKDQKGPERIKKDKKGPKKTKQKRDRIKDNQTESKRINIDPKALKSNTRYPQSQVRVFVFIT